MPSIGSSFSSHPWLILAGPGRWSALNWFRSSSWAKRPQGLMWTSGPWTWNPFKKKSMERRRRPALWWWKRCIYIYIYTHEVLYIYEEYIYMCEAYTHTYIYIWSIYICEVLHIYIYTLNVLCRTLTCVCVRYTYMFNYVNVYSIYI